MKDLKRVYKAEGKETVKMELDNLDKKGANFTLLWSKMKR